MKKLLVWLVILGVGGYFFMQTFEFRDSQYSGYKRVDLLKKSNKNGLALWLNSHEGWEIWTVERGAMIDRIFPPMNIDKIVPKEKPSSSKPSGKTSSGKSKDEEKGGGRTSVVDWVREELPKERG